MATSVFVSGATGFIAQHLVQLLIQQGYKVVGTVRSTEKGDKLKKNLASDNFTYEIVKDIAAPHAFDEALKAHPEVTVFLHTASPFHFKVTDVQKQLLDPAVEGTKNALTSIKEYGPQIKNVVVTSSFAAVLSMRPEDKDKVLTEESWNPVTLEEALSNPISGYIASKTFAERAAWDFVKTEKPHFVLNTVNPSYVFGPQAFENEVGEELNTSNEIINQAIKTQPGADAPANSGYFVDVRDVAKLHITAFTSGTENFRYVLNTGAFVGQDILNIVNENVPQLKGKIATGKPESADEARKQVLKVDVSKTLKSLDKWIDLKQSVVDTVNQVLKVRGQL